jgi:thioesterase domain-containing protein
MVQNQVKKTFKQEEYHSRVVLLQGRPQSKQPCLFLITDGGGSAAVYVHLPTISPDLTVYAVESPFIGGKEEDFLMPSVTVEKVAVIFGQAIRSVQPHGPYMIGGYSVGGVFAYETVRYLINTGDKVHGFLLIDSACPRNLEGIIDISVDVCEKIGMFDSISEEDQRKPLTQVQKVHVAGCTRAASKLEPVPIRKENWPAHSFAIWARVGFVEHLSDKILEVHRAIAKRDGLEMKLNSESFEWLKSEKGSFGPRGWDKLVGDIETFVLDGDHFSIMMRPHVSDYLFFRTVRCNSFGL